MNNGYAGGFLWWWFLWIPLFFLFLWGAAAWSSGRSRRRGYGGYSYDPRYPYSGSSWSDAYAYRSPGRRRRAQARGPRGYRRSDSRILEDISDRLMVDDEVDASDISLQVSEGVVRMTGSVRSRNDKRIAEAIADSVPGVTDVKNELVIGRKEAGQRPKAA